MHKLFIAALLAAFLLPISINAQPTTRKIYIDSLTATSTGDQAAKLARGYGAPWRYLRTDIGAYKDKTLIIKFEKTLDSIGIDGGVVDFGKDTLWTPLPLTVTYPRSNSFVSSISGGGIMYRDTVVARWLTPVGASPIMHRVVDMSDYYFPVYRVVVGLNDSGKTRILDIRRGGY